MSTTTVCTFENLPLNLQGENLFYPDYDVQWTRRTGYYAVILEGRQLATFKSVEECDDFIKAHANQLDLFQWKPGTMQ